MGLSTARQALFEAGVRKLKVHLPNYPSCGCHSCHINNTSTQINTRWMKNEEENTHRAQDTGHVSHVCSFNGTIQITQMSACLSSASVTKYSISNSGKARSRGTYRNSKFFRTPSISKQPHMKVVHEFGVSSVQFWPVLFVSASS